MNDRLGLSFLSQDITAAPVNSQWMASKQDWLIRLTENTKSGEFDVSTTPTKLVWDRLQKWSEGLASDVALLTGIVRWQHSLLEYNAHYIAHLLHQTTEEEFEAAAETFAFEPQQLELDWLCPRVERIFALTQIDYSPSDFAEMFRTDESNIYRALHGISSVCPQAAKLLPKPA